MSEVLEWNKRCSLPFSCCPVSCQCPWKKTLIEKKTAIKDIRNRFTLGKENKVIKDRILRNIRNLFEHEEEENYYKSARVSNL